MIRAPRIGPAGSRFANRTAVAGMSVLIAAPVLAQDAAFTPERRALFVQIIEENGCKMNNFAPSEGIMSAIQANEFTRDEVQAIGQDILKSGDGVREDPNLVLKTEACT